MFGGPSWVTWLIGFAALVTAVGIINRGLIRPVTRVFGDVQDLINQWKQMLESIKALIALVVPHITTTEQRLARLEERLDLKSLVDEEAARAREILLARLLVQADEDGRRDRRKEDRERAHQP